MIFINSTSINKPISEKDFYEKLDLFDLVTQHKIKSFVQKKDRDLSLAGRYLLYLKTCSFPSLKMAIPLQFSYTKYGKPIINNLFFNISHTGSTVVCAIHHQKPIGIDIELKRNISVTNFKNCFTDKEWYTLKHSCNKELLFYNLWTRKEAVIKAAGIGLQVPLNSFDVLQKVVVLKNRVYEILPLKIAANIIGHIAVESNDSEPLKYEKLPFEHLFNHL